MRPIWRGYISFGLVNIPVKLYSAIQHDAVSFKLLHKKDLSPIKYKRFCEKENKEVSWKDITKGLEISRGRFVVMDKTELEKLKPAKSDVIDVMEFVDGSHVYPIYFNSHYFLSPESEGKAFFLFKEVLQSSNKFAIAKFVMREKEYLAVLSSYKKGMLLSTLNYLYEIRNINDILELNKFPQLRKEELELAFELIDKLYKPEFDIKKFKDTFLDQIKEAIKKKEKGEIVEIEKPARKRQNLVDALKASLK